MKTTVNLGLRPLNCVEDAVERLGIRPMDFMRRCLRKKIAALAKMPHVFLREAVVYQERGADLYFIVHINFDWDFYDANLLSRFVRKRSVSLLLAQAIIEFGAEVEHEFLMERTVQDNYPDFFVLISKKGTYPEILWDITHIISGKPNKT